MKTVIVALLVLWLVLTVLGAVLEGLFWLVLLGLLAFVATAAWGWWKVRR